MNDRLVEWKQRAAHAFLPLVSIDRSWLPEALREHGRLLDVGMLTTTARRLIYRHLDSVRGPDHAAAAVPEWALGGYKAQQRKVIRIGAFACAASLRRTVLQPERAMLQRVIDDETYVDAVTAQTALIEDDVEEHYRHAMRTGSIACFIAAMGISVVEDVSPEDRPFVQQTIRGQFSRNVWQMRRKDLTCNRDRALQILHGDDNA